MIKKYRQRIQRLEADVAAIEEQEEEEKALRATENQVNKAERLLREKEETAMADRKRTWFQTHAERKQAIGTSHLCLLPWQFESL